MKTGSELPVSAVHRLPKNTLEAEHTPQAGGMAESAALEAISGGGRAGRFSEANNGAEFENRSGAKKQAYNE